MFLFLTSLICICSGGNAASGSRFFKAERGMALLDHVISTYQVTSPIDCSFQCLSTKNCKSHNYQPGRIGSVCQLNNAKRLSSHASYKPDPDFVHYFDQSQNFKSCLDYLRLGFQENGIYTVSDTSGQQSFPVYCDFSSEPRTAWTLVLSMAFKNRNMQQFCNIKLDQNSPIQENSPNWDAYRLTLERMSGLSAQSTHMRITTGFPVYGVDFVDYLKAKLSSINFVTYAGSKQCKLVEYVNIRGHKGIDVLVVFWQYVGKIFHTDSSGVYCGEYNPTNNSKHSENNFGAYCDNDNNPQFRGSQGESATTQFWIGGSL